MHVASIDSIQQRLLNSRTREIGTASFFEVSRTKYIDSLIGLAYKADRLSSKNESVPLVDLLDVAKTSLRWTTNRFSKVVRHSAFSSAS